MYYEVKLKKKEKLFQKPYSVEDGFIYITDTEKGKKKFLKSGIKNAVFGEEFSDEPLFKSLAKEAWLFDRNFVYGYVGEMAKEVIDRLKLTVPVAEIAVFSDCGEQFTGELLPYGRLITLVGEKEKTFFQQGVPVRRVKKLKKSPDLIICDKKIPEGSFCVPVIDLRENPLRGSKTLAWDRMSFKTDLFSFEINTPALLYFLKKGEITEFKLTSFAKKCRRVFTFS